MDFTLLKKATDTLVKKEITENAMNKIAWNLTGFPQNTQLVCENAVEFLTQMQEKIKNNGAFTPEEVQRMAPMTAALQLISSDDTRDEVLKNIKGESKEKIFNIARGTNDPARNIDKILINIGQTRARTLVDKLVATLNDPRSPDRQGLVGDLQQLADWYQQQSGNANNTPTSDTTPNQKPTPMNQQQTSPGGADTGAPSGTANAGAPTGGTAPTA